MATDSQRLSTADRANLVAYLDGELPEGEARLMEAKLAGSVSGRREAEALRQSWELLEYLPRPSAGADFASRTLTLATQQVDLDDRLMEVAGRTARRVIRVALALVVAAAVAGAAYAAARWVWPDPTSRLARDLSIAESLDAYREVGTFEFLEQLDGMPQFYQAPGEPAPEAGR